MDHDFRRGVYEFRTKLIYEDGELEVVYDHYECSDYEELKSMSNFLKKSYKRRTSAKDAAVTAKFSYKI